MCSVSCRPLVCAAALVTLALAGCASSPSPTPSTTGTTTDSQSTTASATPRAADGLTLPAQIAGWTAQEAPSPAPTTIGNTQVLLQTGVYQNGDASRLVTLIVTKDKGYLESLRKKTTGATQVGSALCGTPREVPNAITCTRELAGGLVQVTATSSSSEELGPFTDELYDSLG